MNHQEELFQLRINYYNGNIDKTTFAIEVANIYSILGLFKRAEAILEILDESELQEDYLLKLFLIKRKLKNYKSEKQTCSLNMIVKNEETNLSDALNSVDTVMDEIVVCDTGSNDKTVEIAQLYGAKIVHYIWNDDFSAARNHALENSCSDFILWMDADDVITNEDSQKLQALWQTSERKATLLRVLNSQANGSFFDFSQVRLFPREEGVYFEQAIHEQIMYSLSRKEVPFSKRSDITIIHRGYENFETHQKKAKRNIKLISKELEKRPNNISLLMSKGDALSVLGKADEAFHIYKEITDKDSNYDINPDIFIQAHLNCANYLIKSKVDRYATPLLDKALKLDPSRTEAMLALGKISQKSGDFDTAQFLFHKAATTTPPARLTATPAQKIRLEAIYSLTDLLIDRGNFDNAATLMTAALKDYPNVPAFYNLSGKVFLLNQKYTEAARFYTMSLNLSPENNEEARRGMAQIYDAIGYPEKSEEYVAACA